VAEENKIDTQHMGNQFVFSRLPFGGSTRTGACRTEYQNDPTNTITAPAASCAFQPLPNHHTLKHKLIALRVVSTTCVDTADTLYISEVNKKNLKVSDQIVLTNGESERGGREGK
jgi:hypothetical protein